MCLRCTFEISSKLFGSLVSDEVFLNPACTNSFNLFSHAQREKPSLQVVFVFYPDSIQKFGCPFYC